MEELPEDNEHDFPQNTMVGFRSMGGTLAELFDFAVVGRLAPLTSIGAIVEYVCTARTGYSTPDCDSRPAAGWSLVM
jgi:hypothetical protein